jgi:hypothetical protein
MRPLAGGDHSPSVPPRLHWAERVQMAQWWRDHSQTMRNGAEVVPMTGVNQAAAA